MGAPVARSRAWVPVLALWPPRSRQTCSLSTSSSLYPSGLGRSCLSALVLQRWGSSRVKRVTVQSRWGWQEGRQPREWRMLGRWREPNSLLKEAPRCFFFQDSKNYRNPVSLGFLREVGLGGGALWAWFCHSLGYLDAQRIPAHPLPPFLWSYTYRPPPSAHRPEASKYSLEAPACRLHSPSGKPQVLSPVV